MWYLKISLLMIILPLFDLYVLNRYAGNIMEINSLLALAVYISLIEDDNVLKPVFVMGIISDIFNNDIIGINATLFIIISFFIFYSKNFVVIATRIADILMLFLSLGLYFVIKVILLYLADSGDAFDLNFFIIFKTMLINIIYGSILFFLMDKMNLSKRSRYRN